MLPLLSVLVFWLWGIWNLSSLPRDWTGASCTGRWSLSQWTTSKAPHLYLLMLCLLPSSCLLSSHWQPLICSLSVHFCVLIFFMCFSFLILFSYLFFSFIFISWRLITLPYCSGFCHTLTWISHGFTCSPSWTPLPPPSPSHPSGSSQCTSPDQLSHASDLDWRSVSHLIIYMFRCCSLRSFHPRLLP